MAARKILAASTKPDRELYLFTDNQEGGWRFDPKVVFDEAWKKADIETVIVKPDDATAVNSAVTLVKVTSPLITEGSRANGVATIQNFSNAPLHDVLQIMIGSAEAASLPVEIPPGTSADIPFDFQVPSVLVGKAARGIAKLQGDNLPLDDQFYFTVPIYKAPRVVVFEGQNNGPPRVHSGFYLLRALAAGSDSTPPALPASAIEETNLTPYSAVFLADIANLSDRAVVKLDNYTKAGGTVVFLPGDLTDVTALNRIDWLPATPLRLRELPEGRLVSQIVAPDDALFANTWGQSTPFPPLPQRKLIEWKAKPTTHVLVTAGDTEGFVMSCDNGAGKVFIINASPDRAWGDFPLSPAFLPLVQQIALLSSEHGRTARGFTVGQPVPATPVLPHDQTLTITLPDKTTQSVLLSDSPVLLARVEKSGFYQVDAPGEPGLLTFEVNVDPKESDLHPILDDALTKIAPHQTVAGMDGLRIWLTQSRGIIPLWPLLAIVLALAFAAESALSNLSARNRVEGEQRHIKTGRLNKRRVGSPFRAAAPEEVEVGV